ncbi:uncharacterized protein EI90DRAFT_2945874 [Cantharellus anzutake]|uniref:uncharacterized protein n=1 Tax=Cantharellus anzutake TaxID=1750568 RepID=UPI00190507AE|nr:uncharacterized protein EI90DRAFT_2945874 [Cantharellus anzutake]KAF8315778.1 hypothetical protein EI90DRAFT_2945874 [Cantharellus anzutake]
MLHWLHIHQTPLLELKSDARIRIHVFPGDLLVLPAGIYHRFTLDESNAIKTLRLFKDEPKWTDLRTQISIPSGSNTFRMSFCAARMTVETITCKLRIVYASPTS